MDLSHIVRMIDRFTLNYQSKYIIIYFAIFIFKVTSYSQSIEKPNIILIIADDIGWNDIGCYGNDVVYTPNIDRIASEGLRFTNAFLTTSSCSPSRTSIISGRYPHNTGAAELHTPLPAGIPIFPELLQKAGYYTAQAGKWHMGDAARRGFDVIHDIGKENGDGGENMWVPTLRNRPMNQPFFMWFASYDAHRPWGTNDFEGTNKPGPIHVPPYLVDTLSTRIDLAKYYDEITRFDDFIGKVEEELAHQGVLENTILIIISDNGRPFPRSKTRMYDSGVKTPFIVKWPKGITHPGEDRKSLISVIDLAPTFLDLANGNISKSFQGKSFSSLLKKEESFRNFIFAEHNWHDQEAYERMVRTPQYMYILNLRPSLANQGPADSNRSPSFQDLKNRRDKGRLTDAQTDVFVTPRPREELYDCWNDSMTLINLVSSPQKKVMLDHLREVMSEWQKITGDTNPDHLTGDWYNRETGEALDVERKRGEMPGTAKNAININAKGPF